MVHAYASLTQLRTEAGITASADTGDDARLLRILEQVTEAIGDYTARTFQPYTATNYYTHRPHPDPDYCGALLLPDDLIAVTTLKTLTANDSGTRTYGDTWATTDYDLEPDNAASRQEPYWLIRENPEGAYSWPRDRRGVQLVGIFGYWRDLEVPRLSGTASATAEALDTSETGVDVTASHGAVFAVGQTILIDAEQMYIQSISTDTLTVLRAQNGTTAAEHVTSSAITRYVYPKPVVDAAILQAQQWNRGFQSGGGDFAGGGSFRSSVPAGLHPNCKDALATYRKKTYL